jgi:hypothetical protein
MVWVYDSTGSVLVAMLMHMPIVVSQYVLRPEALSAEQTFVSLVAYAGGLWLIVGIVSLTHSGRPTSTGADERRVATS